MHVRTHKHTHTQTHAQTHTRAHTRMDSRSHPKTGTLGIHDVIRALCPIETAALARGRRVPLRTVPQRDCRAPLCASWVLQSGSRGQVLPFEDLINYNGFVTWIPQRHVRSVPLRFGCAAEHTWMPQQANVRLRHALAPFAHACALRWLRLGASARARVHLRSWFGRASLCASEAFLRA